MFKKWLNLKDIVQLSIFRLFVFRFGLRPTNTTVTKAANPPKVHQIGPVLGSVGVGEGVKDGVDVGVGLGVAVGVEVGHGDEVGVGVGTGEDVGVGAEVGFGDFVGCGLSVGVAADLSVGVGSGVGVCTALGKKPRKMGVGTTWAPTTLSQTGSIS